MRAVRGDPRKDCWESSRRSSTIPFRAGSPRGTKAAARRRGSAARHRPGGLGPPLPRLEALGYPLLLVSPGQAFSSAFPALLGELWKQLEGFSSVWGNPFQCAPLRASGRAAPVGWAVRRCGDRASLGRKKRSLRLCISLYPPRPTQPLQPSCTLPWLSLPSANRWPPNLSLQLRSPT